jgi:YesN/AraC family two-component response regulator
MSLQSIVPFINYEAAERHPHLKERILHQVDDMGHVPKLIDVGTILFLQTADILNIRVPWVLFGSNSHDESNTQHLFHTLKAKFPTTKKIETNVKDMPRILDEQRKDLTLWPDDTSNKNVRKVMTYVMEQIHNRDLSLKQIADNFITSIAKLENDFHKIGLDKGVWHYVMEIRTKEAFRLMSETLLSAKEISFILGHEDYSSFTRSFKNFYGFSPSKVKKMLRQE